MRYAASASAVSTTTDGRTPNASATAASIAAGASAAVGATQSTRHDHTKEQCESHGCCDWDEGESECFSSVGDTNTCSGWYNTG